jgi:hypothetical protein
MSRVKSITIKGDEARGDEGRVIIIFGLNRRTAARRRAGHRFKRPAFFACRALMPRLWSLPNTAACRDSSFIKAPLFDL